MPVGAAAAMRFGMAEVEERLAGRREPLDLLVQRWRQHVDAGRRERVIWDLALVEAVVRPALAREREVKAPPENNDRRVWVYTGIDAAAMKADFFAVMDRYHTEGSAVGPPRDGHAGVRARVFGPVSVRD
jgi:purine nucleosidase